MCGLNDLFLWVWNLAEGLGLLAIFIDPLRLVSLAAVRILLFVIALVT